MPPSFSRHFSALPLPRRWFEINVALILRHMSSSVRFSTCRADFRCTGTVAAYEPPAGTYLDLHARWPNNGILQTNACGIKEAFSVLATSRQNTWGTRSHIRLVPTGNQNRRFWGFGLVSLKKIVGGGFGNSMDNHRYRMRSSGGAGRDFIDDTKQQPSNSYINDITDWFASDAFAGNTRYYIKSSHTAPAVSRHMPKASRRARAFLGYKPVGYLT
ncbi:hypothetical protein C8J57DRAFT_1463261 [Mycena rebaudengoi]|nr:hypothetical protein C8J57DRAFT_1463261 [Mycena rebaudengoi]